MAVGAGQKQAHSRHAVWASADSWPVGNVRWVAQGPPRDEPAQAGSRRGCLSASPQEPSAHLCALEGAHVPKEKARSLQSPGPGGGQQEGLSSQTRASGWAACCDERALGDQTVPDVGVAARHLAQGTRS